MRRPAALIWLSRPRTGSGIDQEIFRWNNAGGDVDEVNSYNLDNGGTPTTILLDLTGPTLIWVEGYADDDQGWPSSGSNENSLGQASITIDPVDASTVGNRQLGPTGLTTTDTGYVINLSIDVLPGPGAGPDLSIVGIRSNAGNSAFPQWAGRRQHSAARRRQGHTRARLSRFWARSRGGQRYGSERNGTAHLNGCVPQSPR